MALACRGACIYITEVQGGKEDVGNDCCFGRRILLLNRNAAMSVGFCESLARIPKVEKEEACTSGTVKTSEPSLRGDL